MGSTVCQPASGCHVLGDLCLKNADCCGGSINMLPGEGEVLCIPDPVYKQIGTCSMPNKTNCTMNPPNDPLCHNTCIPEGDVCHYKDNGGCPVNSINNDCCAGPGNSGVCKLDHAGVPRCFGIGMCVMAGGTCSSSVDCCNGLPCVPDPTGKLVCSGMMCVPLNGVCTTTADCCTGLACIVPPGSTKGTCINPNPPPTPPDMAGNTDMAGMAPPDLSNPPPMCALDGQSCNTTNTPCCTNNGACLGPSGLACQAAETDCYCKLIL
jgi:hypothetical protein